MNTALLTPAFSILDETKRLPIFVNKEASESKLTFSSSSLRPLDWVAHNDDVLIKNKLATLSKPLRKLAAEAANIFASSQIDHTICGILHFSRMYRQALGRCIHAHQVQGDMNDDIDSHLRTTLATWHLCEITFMQHPHQSRDEPALAYAVANWLQEYYLSTKLEALERNILKIENYFTSQNLSSTEIESHPLFWSTVTQCILFGHGVQAWKVLALHSTYLLAKVRSQHSSRDLSIINAFETLQDLLLNLPMHQKPANEDAFWIFSEKCQRLRTSNTYAVSDPDLSHLLNTLCGDSECIKSATATWYERMLAQLNLQPPRRIANRLEFLMVKCFQDFDLRMMDFDLLIFSILQYDIETALKSICSMQFHFFSAHLSDLLTKAAIIHNQNLDAPIHCSMREYFILNYAMELVHTEGNWQLAILYFETCPCFGAFALRSIVQYPVNSEKKLQRLIVALRKPSHAITQKWATSMALNRSRDCFDKGNYALAMYHTLQSRDKNALDQLCDRLVQECKQSFSPLSSALAFLEADHISTQQLHWLVLYRDFMYILQDIAALQQHLRDSEAFPTSESALRIQQKLDFVHKKAIMKAVQLAESELDVLLLRSSYLIALKNLFEDTAKLFTPEQLLVILKYIHLNQPQKQLQVQIANQLPNSIVLHASGSFAKSRSSQLRTRTS